MIRPPTFWTHDDWRSRILSPLSCAVNAVTAYRTARTGWLAPVPVICCGNATVGGAGKTTLTLDLSHRLRARGVEVHILARGYRGSSRGPRRVTAFDSALTTGDEALLLAETAPTWTGADRAASARAAIAAGAEVLLMDDGLQNSSLEKTLSLLVVDGVTAFGNGRVLPAGPLREAVAAAASRCHAAILIGPDSGGAAAKLPMGLSILHADVVQDDGMALLVGRRVLAFAGIAFPAKFFAGLERGGAILVDRAEFADHHAFAAAELAKLQAKANALDAILVTTPKDAVRLPVGIKVHVVNVSLVWEHESSIEALLDCAMVSGHRFGLSVRPRSS